MWLSILSICCLNNSAWAAAYPSSPLPHSSRFADRVRVVKEIIIFQNWVHLAHVYFPHTKQIIHEPYSIIPLSLSSLKVDWLSISLILFIQMFTESCHLLLHFIEHHTPEHAETTPVASSGCPNKQGMVPKPEPKPSCQNLASNPKEQVQVYGQFLNDSTVIDTLDWVFSAQELPCASCHV